MNIVGLQATLKSRTLTVKNEDGFLSAADELWSQDSL